MNLRGFYKLAGLAALGYALIALASYLSWIYASGFLAATSTPPSGDQVWQMLQAQGNQLAIRLDVASYFLWLPALVGIFAFLRDRQPGRAMLGGAFAALGVVAMFSASTMNSAAMNLAAGPVTDALKDRLGALSTVAFSSLMPGLWGIALANLFWGVALRSEGALAKLLGNLLFGQIAGFLIATGGFIAGNDVAGNSGILINSLAIVASYAIASKLLLGLSREKDELKQEEQEKPRAASASA